MTSLAAVFCRLKVLSLINYNSAILKLRHTICKPPSRCLYLQNNVSNGNSLLINDLENIGRRFKHKKPTKQEDSDDEDSSDEETDKKLISGHVTSLRADAVLKAGLELARNKIEKSFYESKLRVNGKKILKKSHHIEIGDEIDMVKAENPLNKNFLDVSRIIVVSAKESSDGDKLIIKMERYKSLTIENYDKDAWKN